MKKTIYTLLGLLLAAGLTSCQDWFIEKPEVTGMDQDEVFSTAKNAEGAIAEAYATILSSGLPVLVWNNYPIHVPLLGAAQQLHGLLILEDLQLRCVDTADLYLSLHGRCLPLTD